MEALKKRRSVLKGQMTKIVSFADAIETSTKMEQIKARLDKSHELWSEFVKVEDKMFELASDTPSLSDEFDDNYYHAVAQLNAALRHFHTASATLNISGTAGDNTGQFHAGSHETKLPRMNIPVFDGNFQEWQSFFDLFNSAVHEKVSLTAAQKLQYLKGLLKGEPLGLIKHLNVTDANYVEAYQILIKRYDKKKLTINRYIETFFKQPSITRVSSPTIRHLADTAEEIIRGLKAIGPLGEVRDPWLIYIIVSKLDDDSRQYWQHEAAKIEYPTFQNLMDCLQIRADTLEGIRETVNKPMVRMPSLRNAHTTFTTNLNCPLCDVEHMLYQCSKFRDMNVLERRNFINNKMRCYNCLSDSHTVRTCKSKRSCQICRKRHNSLLHVSNPITSQSVPRPSTEPVVNTVQISPNSSKPELTLTHAAINITPNTQLQSINTTTSPINIIPISHLSSPTTQTPSINTHHTIPINQKSSSSHPTFHSLLPTAMVHVTDARGLTQPCRILLDSGSQASFITEACINRLALPRYKANITIKGVGSSTAGATKSATNLEISPRFNTEPKLMINALILPTITATLPSTKLNPEVWDRVKNLQLADPKFHESGVIDILIGADHFFEVLTEGKIPGDQGQPVAQNTIFGWIIAGTTSTEPTNCLAQLTMCAEPELDQLLRNFWEIEEVPVTKHLTIEEALCETHFAETYQRTTQGRFIVKLPFKREIQPIGDTRDRAIKRFFAVEGKLIRNPELNREYTDFMREYLKLGHMERVDPNESSSKPKPSYYMPHHAVVKHSSTTTKVRVVFDASAKSTTNVSLNDNLMVGPTVQDSLFTILVRFRKHSIVFTSDIEKMYRQILIDREDADYQRIVWRESPDEPINDYRLLTVTYGTASAPYLATKTLTTIADIKSTTFPSASKVIKQDLYIDDLMSGANCVTEAVKLQGEIISLLEAAGFHLRKWTSNNPALLKTIPTSSQELTPIEISEGTRSIKLLGLQWCPRDDAFHFQISSNVAITKTKRELLSEASKIFDPLGWLSPSIIMIKILFQSLWLLNLQWDDPLPTNIATKWHEFREELNQIDKISVPRWLFTRDKPFQLHGFSDASELAYAAVIYTRTETEDGTIQTNIVCAKTRVAPIKHLSIPRLELCGALLLTRLMKIVIESLQAENIEIFYWTDSTNVLWWLSSLPRCWKSYVANRTAEILESTSRVNWSYVPTTENPADCASRGIIPSKLHNVVLWWKGPEWLQLDQEFWPTQDKLCQRNHRTNEERPITTQSLSAIAPNNLLEDLAPRYSTFTKLIRIIARLCQFLNNIRRSRGKEHTTILSVNEYEQSKNVILKWVQQTSFATELACLKNQKLLPKGSKLLPLNPFIDDHGILRVGSRIKYADIEYSAKFPTILPAKHIITDLIIQETHTKYMHAAQSLLVATLRQRYWILNCKNLVRQHIHRCVQCTRYKPQKQTQLMGDLPPARVNMKYVFNQTGVDYAGPITLRSMVGRRSKTHKGYVAIFVCMSSKAVHIELVSDVSTSAFLAALKRFMARRGLCADKYSDNGTNFVGARNQLHHIYKLNRSKQHNNRISNFLLEYQTRWHFSPPSGPNFGGLYESAVKSMKYHLRRVVGNTILNFEEMTTMLTQIEAILNSRPLCTLPASPDNIEVLTPAHFIIGHSMALPPDHDHTTTKQNLLTRWQHIQYMMQHFWRRFRYEYLTTLHNRSKWQHKQANLKPGDIVLLRDDNTPPAQWPLGRIKQVHPGLDGLVRVASIQAKAGIFKRPVSKLVVLPVS